MDNFAEDQIGFFLRLPLGTANDGHEATIDGVIEGGNARSARNGAMGEQERRRVERGLNFFSHMRGHSSKLVIAKGIKGCEKSCNNRQGVPTRVRRGRGCAVFNVARVSGGQKEAPAALPPTKGDMCCSEHSREVNS